MDFVLEAQHKIDDSNKAALRRHARAAHAAGFKNVHLLLATSDHPGEMICQAAKEKHVDTIVLGRRGMGAIKRLILGSVSRFVVEVDQVFTWLFNFTTFFFFWDVECDMRCDCCQEPCWTC